jgi:hypothetical protein
MTIEELEMWVRTRGGKLTVAWRAGGFRAEYAGWGGYQYADAERLEAALLSLRVLVERAALGVAETSRR